MAAAVFIQEGSAIDHTPSSALSAGDVVVQADLVGVVVQDIAANELGALKVEGIFDFDKLGSDVINFGDELFWDDTLNHVTLNAAAGANKSVGKAVEDADATKTRVEVRMSQ